MSTTPDLSRDEIEALLVFLANDTLEGPERDAVEAAVAADPQLAGELDALRAMRAEMQTNDADLPSPGEIGLARLMRDIDADGQTAAPAMVTPEPANLPNAPRFWQIAAVVLFGLFVAQTAFLGFGSGPDVELASGDDTGVIDTELTLRVAFDGSATEADIRALLLELDLIIVDGPSALGLYSLAASDETGRANALQTLQERSDL
ncbi:MAG: hypothetical protein AAGF56_14280, partial [Pseudomonadota bacterium]